MLGGFSGKSISHKKRCQSSLHVVTAVRSIQVWYDMKPQRNTINWNDSFGSVWTVRSLALWLEGQNRSDYVEFNW